jgi:glycosyltransferase involved in cell wall biosynthesis
VKRLAILLMGDYLSDSRVKRTARALAKDWRVKVFCLAEPGRKYPTRDEDIRLEYISLFTRKLPKHPAVQAVKFLEFGLRTLLSVCRYRPSVVWANDAFTITLGWVCKRLGMKTIYDAHEYWADFALPSQNAAFYRVLYRLQALTIRSFDLVTTIGECIAERMVADHKIPMPMLLPNTCEARELPAEPDLWAKWSIPAGTDVILYQGLLDDARGLENLVRSVPGWDPGAMLVFQGDGPLRSLLESEAKRLGIAHRVVFTGMIPEPETGRHARACALGVIPCLPANLNYKLSLSNKFFAYGINGVPILASDLPQMRRLIDEYGLGAVFDPLKPDKIAYAVNDARRKKLRIEPDNLHRFIADYSWTTVSERLRARVLSL